ncbi:MAG: hypothetical protein QNJ94_00070 [Alphaproteobacteria bacterium]|nr:hypothetical protein [Alphaproteobacteria bacterium]
MGTLSSKLRIGEKVGLSFGFVGLLFLAVIWQYHATLQRSLADYQGLLDVYEARKSHMLAIESSMLEARSAEKNFRLNRDEADAALVADRVARVQERAAALAEIDDEAAQVAKSVSASIQTYQERFQAVAEAWRIKGLDHNSGLQGAFRDTVHELEDRAAHFKVSSLYLQLLQIRRREKDLGLRRDAEYRENVFGLVEQFKAELDASGLTPDVKASLGKEIDTYRQTFIDYSRTVLAQEDIRGGTGPFRQAAHRIEAILQAQYVPDMERNILQLRRREKDYLLRDDKQYVEMAQRELQRITAQVDAAAIADQHKAELKDLIANYDRDFLALVEQNDRIDRLSADMQQAVEEISLLVNKNVDEANRLMAETAASITETSNADAQAMLWVVLLATLLGVAFAVVITLRITQPLGRMTDLLTRLAVEEPTERVAAIPGSRDEVNIMAEAVNEMADLKARMMAWWKASMEEAQAERDLTQEGPTKPAAAEQALAAAKQARGEQLAAMGGEIRGHTQGIVDAAGRLSATALSKSAQDGVRSIDHAGKAVLAILDVIAAGEPPQKAVAE